jgi:hypothetical protein
MVPLCDSWFGREVAETQRNVRFHRRNGEATVNGNGRASQSLRQDNAIPQERAERKTRGNPAFTSRWQVPSNAKRLAKV